MNLDVPTLETWLLDAAGVIRGAADAPKVQRISSRLRFVPVLPVWADPSRMEVLVRAGS
jgi:hypothetical protein